MGLGAIAGLGNPGPEYCFTRHNIGFMLLDRLAHSQQSSVNWRSRDGAEFAKLACGPSDVLSIKPQKYMNLSGPPVQSLLSFFKVDIEELVVAHDDVDLPFGALRFKMGGGDGGHKGVRSIAQSLGSNNFLRLKLGVGRPAGAASEQEISSWVLGRFGGEEEEKLIDFIDLALDALEVYGSKGLKAAQNEYNRASQGKF